MMPVGDMGFMTRDELVTRYAVKSGLPVEQIEQIADERQARSCPKTQGVIHVEVHFAEERRPRSESVDGLEP